jgi:hypothetical protein
MAGWSGGIAAERTGESAQDTPDASGIAAEVGGEGLAIGDDTLTIGDSALRIVDHGPVTFVTGTATVSSAAESPDGREQPAAYADTFADVTGADLVFIFSVDTSGGGRGGSGSWETATSTKRLFAMDVEGFDFAAGQQTVLVDLTRDVGDHHAPATSGNFSMGSAESNASGGETYTLAQTETVTTDYMSGVVTDAYGLIA